MKEYVVKLFLSSRYDNSDRNWEQDPIGNSHLISPSSSLPLIVLQPKRDQINLKLNPANLNEILMKYTVPVHHGNNDSVACNLHFHYSHDELEPYISLIFHLSLQDLILNLFDLVLGAKL